MTFWKYSGLFLSLTGVLHICVAIIDFGDKYKGMISDGFVRSLSDTNRALAFWFLVIGGLLIIMGQTLSHYIKQTQQPPPLFLGYILLAFSIVGCFIVPVSGFWLFIPQALIIILAKR